MALMDAQTLFSDAQALTATAASTNYYDAGASRNLGAGKTLKLLVDITAVGGTSPTLTVALEGADDTAFTTNKITIDTVTPTLTSGTAYGFVRMAIPSHTAKRYFRVYYTAGGTNPTATVTASFVMDEQTTPMA